MACLHLAIGIFPFGDQSNDRVRGVGFEFGAVGTRQARHMPGVFDGGDLHT